MARLSMFVFTSLDGYYKGLNEDISWHRHGPEENEFAAESMKGHSTLIFGRKTYEMMAGYWPTEMAKTNDPIVASGMNHAHKIVFSRTLQEASWENTKLIKDDLIQTIKQLKATEENDMTILGSGSVITQLAAAGLIDHYSIMIDPVVLGKGTTLFSGMPQLQNLQLIASRIFNSGCVLLNYVPAETFDKEQFL
ncbi:dihydrofolate reductase family protein [Taibaiella soli]|uniref:Dihydrofolate reductase n=1 Tax=Taibaiella soli TaxID=1649169 RepID=A0A2W2AX78_9BACT|nr:dihydrofolate reductase family protein [Taibaiella soli]PZF72318.1 dihydrofolate reductase [Taibaiella soli]